MSKVRHIGKYKFEDKETFLDKKEALGVDEEGNATHPHLIVELGYELITPATETDRSCLWYSILSRCIMERLTR